MSFKVTKFNLLQNNLQNKLGLTDRMIREFLIVASEFNLQIVRDGRSMEVIINNSTLIFLLLLLLLLFYFLFIYFFHVCSYVLPDTSNRCIKS